MRVQSVLLGLAAAAAAAVAANATAQQEPGPSPAPPPAAGGGRPAVSGAEAHRLRGALAWRRAVWTGDREQYSFAARELEQALRLSEVRDFSTLFLLACSRAWRGDVAGATEPAREARALAPDFPGHLLLDAVRAAPEPRGPDWKARFRTAVGGLEAYEIALAKYDRGAAFAAELEYLGHLEHGVRLYWLDLFDRAILQFERAAQIARAQGRSPSPELLRRLSQCHKSVQQFEISERMIRDSLERDPGEPSHYQVLGQLAADRERRDEARGWYQRALARKLDYADPRAKLAYLARDDGDLYSLRVHLEAYRAIHEARWEHGGEPRDPGVEANIHSGFGHYWFARAEKLADEGRLDAARPCYLAAKKEFEAAIAKEPGCIAALNGLVRVLYELGFPADESLPYQRRIEDMRNEEPGAPEPYGDTFC